jgi:hypothetical protein
MKTKGKGIILFLLPALITALSSCTAAIDSIDPVELLYPMSDAYLVSLDISSPPTKRAYELNEPADWTGLIIYEHHSTNWTKVVYGSVDYDYINANVSGFDSSSPGEKTITFSKNGLSVSFTITVNPGLVSMHIISNPNTMTYEWNQSANWWGLVIEETYSDGSTIRRAYQGLSSYADYTVSGFDSLSPGEKTITFSKNGLSVSFTVTVNSPRLVSMHIASYPNKTTYALNEPADWTGLVIRENYSDGSAIRIEYDYADYTVSGFDSSSPGPQTITFSKNGLGVSFTVTVNP